jgi:hypothetical protein
VSEPQPIAVGQPQIMTEAEWFALGKRLFGEDHTYWRFKCPHCSNVMSMRKARGLSDAEQALLRESWHIESECIGRYLTDAGCNWVAYGLFSGPFFVVRDDDHHTPVFGFDMDGAL